METICKTINTGSVKYDIVYMTNTGTRDVNEDTAEVIYKNNTLLLMIADGLGGHGNGDKASRTACRIAKKEFFKIQKLCKKAFDKLFFHINENILKKHTKHVQMKTTLALTAVKDGYLYLAHLGDTRIYVFSQNQGYTVTHDHTLAFREMKKKKGDLDSIRNNQNRHILDAALGSYNMQSPSVSRIKACAGMSVLICSDGFWEYVDESVMTDTLEQSKSTEQWLNAMCAFHKERAQIYSDNYSAICLKINPIREAK